jgi:hypothetical protein
MEARPLSLSDNGQTRLICGETDDGIRHLGSRNQLTPKGIERQSVVPNNSHCATLWSNKHQIQKFKMVAVTLLKIENPLIFWK